MEFPLENSLSNEVAHTKVKASLRIMGECFDIQNITDILRVMPNQTWNKGDSIRNSGKKRTYTAWIYSTESIESLNINTSINQIEELFSSKVDEMITLKEVYKLDISIDIVIIIENEEPPAIYFEPEFIKFAAKIGARFDIDTYIN